MVEQGKKQSQTGLALGITLGIAIGVSIGVATDQLALWIGVGLALGIAMGVSHDEKRKRRRPPVKVVDGATYTIARRTNPQPGRRNHYWLGDNGGELELTDDEAGELKLD